MSRSGETDASAIRARRIVLASHPQGRARETDFRVEDFTLPAPREGEVRLRNRWLSIDPYMRGRMDATRSYARGVTPGEVMVGRTLAEVMDSRHPDWKPGDIVAADGQWQTHCIVEGDAAGLRRIDPALVNDRVPLTWHLGALGMPGATAWIGMIHINQPRAGETAVVSAASGAVGMVAVQLAKFAGLRVVGIAGGPQKCGFVERELGADACIDYRQADWKSRLAETTPGGVDVYYDNVGGEILDTVLERLNPHSRIALCGVISRYAPGERHGLRNTHLLLINRVKLQGFLVFDDPALAARGVAALTEHALAGRLRYRESIAEGLESAPRALLGLLEGANFGKQLVRIA